MKKIFITVALAVAALTVSAGEGWPANYGGVMLQGFYWDSYADTKWTALTARADELSQYFDLIWIPNAGTTSDDYYTMHHNEAFRTQMGYMPCFWLDYNTIFGNEAELRTLIDTYREKGVGIIEDVVINHKNGLMSWANFPNETVTGQNTRKTYTLTWDNTNYSGICRNDEGNYADGSDVKGKLTGADDTGDGFIGCRDLDHTNAQVRTNIKVYLDYLLNELGFAGFRYDMVKGYGAQYVGEYNQASNPMFSVGEYWDSQENTQRWIDYTKNNGDQIQSAAFDFELKNKINAAFNSGAYSNFKYKSFTADPNYSRYSVTFAENHDTWRENDNSKALNSNWSAANAFILTMPGTPCVFYKHYLADPTNIGAMILARKKAGITNQSQPIRQHEWGNWSGYVLENSGDNGSIYCEFGTAVGATNPGGNYFVVADGGAYRFYAAEKGSRVVYFNNTEKWSNVYAHVWQHNGNVATATTWPGTQLTERTPEGYYKYTIPEGCDMIIFNSGSKANQTADLTISGSTIYTVAGPTANKLYVPTGNSLLLTTRPTGILGSNVVDMSAAGNYTCSNLVITDGYKYDADVNFTATTATYSRKSSYEWGTLCLPFAAESNDAVQFYTLSSASDETLTFSPVTSVAAGQPIVYKVLSAKNAEGKYELNITSTGTNVVSHPIVTTPINGWTMEGCFDTANCQSSDGKSVLYIAQNKFWDADVEVSAPAFRAWLTTAGQVAASNFRIVEENVTGVTISIADEAAPIPATYNLSGQRVGTPQMGVNIENGKKVIR